MKCSIRKRHHLLDRVLECPIFEAEKSVYCNMHGCINDVTTYVEYTSHLLSCQTLETLMHSRQAALALKKHQPSYYTPLCTVHSMYIHLLHNTVYFNGQNLIWDGKNKLSTKVKCMYYFRALVSIHPAPNFHI